MSRKIITIPHFFNNLTYNRQYFWSFLTKNCRLSCISIEKSNVFFNARCFRLLTLYSLTELRRTSIII